MKAKIFLFGFVAASMFAAQSCDDYLDTEPLSNGILVDNNDDNGILYETAEELEGALSGAYSDFKNEYFMLDYYVNGDAQADNSYAGADNPANFQIDEYKISSTNSNVSRDWGYLYGTIGKANRVINNAEFVPDPNLTIQRRDQIVGEAKFIRAFCYFQLVQLFGDVPLVIEEVTSIDAGNILETYPLLFPERSTAEEVYAQIILDFTDALNVIPATAADKGFATKGAANALLAKVYATKEPHDWTKVIEYTNAVIDGGYSLVATYDELWDNSQENSSESIFEINCYNWDTGGNWGVFMFGGNDWKKFNTPTNDLVKLYDDEGDDIRKNSNIVFSDVTGKWTDPYWPLTNYPFINKYRDFSGAQNFILIRLADIMLLKAEALNELNDVTAAAELVNEIRTRVELSATPADTQEEMRLAIEKERRLELAFEGHRWYDLKRTGRAIEVINNMKNGNNQSLGYNLVDERLVWPIPQSERDKNTKLTQNPGY